MVVLFVLTLALANVGTAYGDLLVTSRETNSVVRFTDAGQFIEVFVPGITTDLAANEALNGGLVGPVGIAMRPGDNDHLYVVSSGITRESLSSNVSSILRYDIRTGAFVDVYATGGDLEDSTDLAFDAAGNAYVSNFGDFGTFAFHDNVVKFGPGNTPAGTFASLPFPAGAVGVEFGPNNDLFVSSFANNAIYRYDATTGAQIGTDPFIPLVLDGAGGAGLLYHDGYLYASSVSLGDPSTANSVIMRFDVLDPSSPTTFIQEGPGENLSFPGNMAIAPNGNLLVASLGIDFQAENPGQILEYDINDGTFIGVYAQGNLVGPGAILFAAVPEPSTFVLGATGAGMLGLCVWRRRRRKV